MGPLVQAQERVPIFPAETGTHLQAMRVCGDAICDIERREMETCVLCGRNAKYTCDGCDIGSVCGYCARLVHVVWIGKVMTQRLCPPCRLSEDNPMANGIFDASKFAREDIEKALGIERGK